MGRPKAFDRSEALDRAWALFLRKGYEATSVRDLVSATGLNRFSLYDTFGDKHGLFLAALDRYHGERRAMIESLLGASGPKLPLIRRYFQGIIEDAMRLERPGCLMLNSTIELARTDPEVATRAARHFANIEELFVQALKAAEAKGEIRFRRDPHSIARFLLNNARGLRVIVSYTQDRSVVEDILATVWSIFDADDQADRVDFQNVRSENRAAAAI